VRGLDPRTHEKPDVSELALVSQTAGFERNARKAAGFRPINTTLTGQGCTPRAGPRPRKIESRWANRVLLGADVSRQGFSEASMDFLKPYADHLQSILRIMSGLLFLQHGTTKYLSIPVTKMSGAAPMTMSGAAGIIELVGGILLVIGLFTRPVAFILSGTMAVAYFYAHFPRGFYPILNGGELAALYCFVFLYIAAAGGGAWSLDRMRTRGA
jgi:putative oxidoreductase